MKRINTGRRTGRMAAPMEDEQGFWPSYADMMSSFALILFFLMLIAYLQNMITGNQLISTEEVLEQTKVVLASTEDDLKLTKEQVEDAKLELSGLTLTLEDLNQALLLKQEEAARYEATIAGQSVTITEQEDRIKEQTQRISDQQEYIAMTTEELTKLRTQMETIALLRLSILNKVKDSISASLGDTSSVSIGDNGSIVLNEGLFFDYNSSTVKKEGYALLDHLIEAFASFLSDEENAKYVDSIVISGHTDNVGNDSSNRALSTARANAVLNYLMEKDGGRLDKYESYFCAAGYGSTRPVASNATAQGRSANRRIEISIILKDESVMEIVDAYLEQEMPGAKTGTN